MTTLGQRIKALRNQKNMTQAELAKGRITRNQLGMIEKGTANPSLDTLMFIAERLEVPVADLFDGDRYKEYTAFMRKCNAKLMREEYAEAIENVEKFLSEIGNADDFAYRDIIGTAYSILGLAHLKLKNESARGCLEKSLAYLDADESATYCCESLSALGGIAYAEGRFDRSEALLKEAYGIINKFPLCSFGTSYEGVRLKFDILLNLMLTHRAQGKLLEAIDCGEECVKHANDNEYFRRTFGKLSIVMSHMWVELRDYEKALEHSLRAANFLELINNKQGMYAAYIDVASVYRRMGLFQESLDYIAQAVQHFEKEKIYKKLIRAQCEQVKTQFFVQDDAGGLISAIGEIIDSEYIKPQDKAVMKAISSLLQLPGQNPKNAIESLLDCEKELAQYGDMEFMLYVYYALSKIYRGQGNQKVEYDYILKFSDLKLVLLKDIDT